MADDIGIAFSGLAKTLWGPNVSETGWDVALTTAMTANVATTCTQFVPDGEWMVVGDADKRTPLAVVRTDEGLYLIETGVLQADDHLIDVGVRRYPLKAELLTVDLTYLRQGGLPENEPVYRFWFPGGDKLSVFAVQPRYQSLLHELARGLGWGT